MDWKDVQSKLDSIDWSGASAPSSPVGGSAVYHVAVRWTLPQGTTVDGPLHAQSRTLFEKWLGTHDIDNWVYQTEDPSGQLTNVHFQCYLHLKTRIRADQLRVSLFNTIKGVSEYKHQTLAQVYCAPSSTAGKDSLQTYCMKAESRIAGPWGKKPIYSGADLPTKLHEWQGQVNDLVIGKPDNRTVHWIADKGGNSGKSTLCKYLMFHHKACILRFAKIGDMLQIISQNRNKKIYMFDLSRTKPSDFKMDDLYAVMEQLKDGLITSGKYNSTTWMQETAHVIVLSNYYPTKEAMSDDRWKVWSLENGKLI